MLRRIRSLFFGASILLMASVSALAADNKLEAIGAYTDSGASDGLKKALDSKGWRISTADGAYCDVWLRTTIPAGKNETSGAAYTSVSDSTLIGVITFAKPTTDYRGQAVKAGSYTMRYAVHPADGNHLGISPIRDFLVIVPVAMDPNPDAQFKFEELMKMSTKVTGTNHPGVLSLINPSGAPPAPKVESDENNHIVFSFSIKNQSGATIPISLIVKGRAEQ
ncbi:MAG TPA: hypothetical protein VKN18_22300 [Blastocatellia bacterium]|nr:hypothetical protein [Blastocatellia bacterium]